MHFCEDKAELFPLGENVFTPGWFSVVYGVGMSLADGLVGICNKRSWLHQGNYVRIFMNGLR
jgi:hypothetical protein